MNRLFVYSILDFVKKERFLSYLPPRQLLVNWRVIPSAVIYLLGMSLLFFSAMFTGYINPKATYHYSWLGIFKWQTLLISFLFCCTAPLVAPTILRHRLLLLVFALLGFIFWTAVCVFLYVLIFGVESAVPPHARFHFL